MDSSGESTHHVSELFFSNGWLDVDLCRIIRKDSFGEDVSLPFGKDAVFEDRDGVEGAVREEKDKKYPNKDGEYALDLASLETLQCKSSIVRTYNEEPLPSAKSPDASHM